MDRLNGMVKLQHIVSNEKYIKWIGFCTHNFMDCVITEYPNGKVIISYGEGYDIAINTNQDKFVYQENDFEVVN